MVTETTNVNINTALMPDRHPQMELFICDVADAVLKDLTAYMEHPFFSLSKKPETAIRRYEHSGSWLEIVPSVKGLATIYDKDILIYCISQIIAKLNRGEAISRKVRLVARDLLVFTNRGTSGRDYIALCEALDRLDGTRIRTNIRRGDEEQFSAFGLIDTAAVARKFGNDGRLLWCEVTLSEWVFDAIRNTDVLTLHRDYFRLRKPLERRIYEIARKHCGHGAKWVVGYDNLLLRSGSKSPMKRFRQMIRDLAASNHLPDYTLRLEGDLVIFENRNTMKKLSSELVQSDFVFFAPETREQVRGVAPGWDVDFLEQEWRRWMSDGGLDAPRNPDSAFIGFCRKWFERNGRP